MELEEQENRDLQILTMDYFGAYLTEQNDPGHLPNPNPFFQTRSLDLHGSEV